MPFTPEGGSVKHFFESGTEDELEIALKGWPRREIAELESKEKGSRKRCKLLAASEPPMRKAGRKRKPQAFLAPGVRFSSRGKRRAGIYTSIWACRISPGKRTIRESAFVEMCFAATGARSEMRSEVRSVFCATRPFADIRSIRMPSWRSN